MYLYIGILAASLPTIVNADPVLTPTVGLSFETPYGSNVTVDEERGGKAAVAAELIKLGAKLIIDEQKGNLVNFWEYRGNYIIESECWEDGSGPCPNGNCLDYDGPRGMKIQEISVKCAWFCFHRTHCRRQTCCPFTNERPHTAGGNGGNPTAEITDGACYEDDRSRLLDDFHRSSTNTPMECKRTCAGRGYAYAGVQYTNECFCGNTKPPATRIRDSSQCNIRCPGDASLKCGGSWRMNIYRTGNPSTEITDGTCYEDDRSRLLDDFHRSSTNTPMECKRTCAGRGYGYAGVQYTNECFCGNTKPPATRIRDSSQCNIRCPGDASLKCGGAWRMNIYRTGNPSTGTKPRQENIADLGYRPNCGAGWYDVQGQGVKNDYCRWVGNCGCRGDCSWWSCALAGSNKPNSPKGEYTEAG